MLDPGEKLSVAPVLRREDVVTALEARGREGAPRVGDDAGDVIVFEARHRGEATGVSVVHRAIAWIEYNATADAYDVPDLGLRGVRAFSVPQVGTWDPFARVYAHHDLGVRLDPDRAGRHDGFLTKGDHNGGFDQEADGGLASVGDVHLVAPRDVEGKVVDWLEPHETDRTALWAFGAALTLGVGIVAGRRALRGRLPAKAGRRSCAACGKTSAPDAAFRLACGAERPK